jgi:hypothetical protein
MTIRAARRARDFLTETQNNDGGWGYRVGNGSVTEPTALAVIVKPSQSAWEKGLTWLLRAQRDDGGWGISQTDDGSNWQTVWASWAALIAASGDSLQSARRGADWVLEMPVARVDDPITNRLLGIDSLLNGWPWQPQGGTWVEPTALSLLLLLASGITDHPRVREGVAFLRDRTCSGGGWNVGAPFNFGKQMSPTPHTTALALMALQAAGADRADPIIKESLIAMRHMLDLRVSASTLAWGISALRVWQVDDASLCDRLLQMQSGDGDWENNPYATASALLALQGPTTILSPGE